MIAKAARKGDTTAHGGLISKGLPSVLIESLPAARVGDMHVCPLHGGGPILPPGESSVLIGNKPAARVSDWAECKGPIDVIITGANRTMIGLQVKAPPEKPSITTSGTKGESQVWNYTIYINAGWVLNVGGAALVAAAAGAVVAAAAAAVVWLAVVKVNDSYPDDYSIHSSSEKNISFNDFLSINSFQKGVRPDAPVYFL